jgi:hypothetical protein
MAIQYNKVVDKEEVKLNQVILLTLKELFKNYLGASRRGNDFAYPSSKCLGITEEMINGQVILPTHQITI